MTPGKFMTSASPWTTPSSSSFFSSSASSCAGGRHVGRGDTARGIGDDAERQIAARLDHETDARHCAGDVGDLVRVGDGGRDAPRDDGGRKLRRQAEGTLDVYMTVDQAGG